MELVEQGQSGSRPAQAAREGSSTGAASRPSLPRVQQCRKHVLPSNETCCPQCPACRKDSPVHCRGPPATRLHRLDRAGRRQAARDPVAGFDLRLPSACGADDGRRRSSEAFAPPPAPPRNAAAPVPVCHPRRWRTDPPPGTRSPLRTHVNVKLPFSSCQRPASMFHAMRHMFARRHWASLWRSPQSSSASAMPAPAAGNAQCTAAWLAAAMREAQAQRRDFAGAGGSPQLFMMLMAMPPHNFCNQLAAPTKRPLRVLLPERALGARALKRSGQSDHGR
jgi:hypothetical protein